ncbi:MAG TPA: GcrA family cell cycle regulator [Patescibacteria group bacterium]|nr:GcrA family cell cycle regulator [Patescibacteria group bacterium]
MLDRMMWSEDEVVKLETLYKSGMSMDEIENALPHRSRNAIRQKASRLGLKRPISIRSVSSSQTVIRCSSSEEGEEYLFKCGECGGWIYVSLEEGSPDRTIECPQCRAVSRYVA